MREAHGSRLRPRPPAVRRVLRAAAEPGRRADRRPRARPGRRCSGRERRTSQSRGRSALNPFMALGPDDLGERSAPGCVDLLTDPTGRDGRAGPAGRGDAAPAVRGRPTTSTSTPPSTTPPTSAGSSGPTASALLPNWRHLPVGYHGRAGTVVVSGTDGRTGPAGQRKAPADAAPTFGPSRRLDIEAELGFVVGTPPSARAAGPDHRVRRPRLRRDRAQRLVGARHPGLGVRPARAVPRQVVRDLDLRLGHAAGRARRRVGRPARPGPDAAALPGIERGPRARHRRRGRGRTARSSAVRRTRRCTGRRPRCSPT